LSEIVSLSRFRKKKARAEKEKRAQENRVKFGRAKAEKKKTGAERSKLKRHVDQHRREEKD